MLIFVSEKKTAITFGEGSIFCVIVDIVFLKGRQWNRRFGTYDYIIHKHRYATNELNILA